MYAPFISVLPAFACSKVIAFISTPLDGPGSRQVVVVELQLFLNPWPGSPEDALSFDGCAGDLFENNGVLGHFDLWLRDGLLNETGCAVDVPSGGGKGCS